MKPWQKLVRTRTRPTRPTRPQVPPGNENLEALPLVTTPTKPKLIQKKRRQKSLILSLILLSVIFLTTVGIGGFHSAIAQPPTTPAPPNKLGEQLLTEVVACLRQRVANSTPTNPVNLEAASTQCMFNVVLLNPDGTVRIDASDRLTALLQTSGITLPQPNSKGQATVQLQQLPDSQIFTLPVQIAGQTKPFLLDTGASGSIIDSQTAKQLNLESTPIPNELFQYTVVGDNCPDLQANVHRLPILAVAGATVEGLSGMGLPQTAIPGNLSGVLGLDFLSGFDMILNPKTKQLKLLSPSQNASEKAIPLIGKLGNITAQVQVNNQQNLTFVLDTGAELNVISSNLAQRLNLDLSKAKEIEVKGFCGTQKAKQTKLNQISLQQYQGKELDTVILDSPIFRILGVDGIIGQNFLNKYQQHWRFGKRNALGFADEGSLELSPF